MNLLIPGAAPAPTPDEQTFSALELALRGPDKEQAGLRAVAAIQALEQRVRQRCAQGLPLTNSIKPAGYWMLVRRHKKRS